MRKILSLILGLLWALPVWGALPTGYTELEYIESTGTQYIDTGIYLASNMVVVVKAEQTGTSGNIFGYTQGDSGRWMFSLNATTSTATLYSDKTNVVGSFSSMPVEVTCNMGTGITVNGITTNFTESATRTAPSTAWLFKAQGSSATPSGRIYYFKIYQNNNLIMNLVPAKNSSDVLGMYDLVSGQFFTNAGTGEFVAGPVVEIKIATTKYNESAFGPLNTALANAISVVDSVVSNTITQAGRIATLQAQKQTRPADDPSDANNAENCPAGKKCLLVEDASGIPHWYEIVENAWDLPVGYTQLQYIESTGTQWIDTGYAWASQNRKVDMDVMITTYTANSHFFASTRGSKYDLNPYFSSTNSSFNTYIGNTSYIPATSAKDVKNNIVWNLTSDKKFSLQVNGTSVGTATVTEIPTSEISVWLLHVHSSGNNTWTPLRAKLYQTKMWDNDELVRDFVPAKNPDGKIGMYDTVEGRFYENAGTDEFIAGPVAE